MCNQKMESIINQLYGIIKNAYIKKYYVIIIFFFIYISFNHIKNFNKYKPEEYQQFYDYEYNNFHNNTEYKNYYINQFNNLKNNYIDPFLKYYLRRISLISYDYTNLTKMDNYKIHICLNLNNKYIYPALISMESALKSLNKDKYNLVYHILCSGDFTNENLNKIKSLLDRYPLNLEIIFYDMDSIFINFKKQHFTQVTYYRLFTPLFIPLNRIIYLDTDVLILNDLIEMYLADFNNNYVLGTLDVYSGGVDHLGIKSDRYVNAGVLLINLYKIRKDKKARDLIKTAKDNKKLNHHDQTVINYVLYPNIGLLPFKFGLLNFQRTLDIEKNYLKRIRQKLNLTELIKAYKNPSLIHLVFCFPKAWSPRSTYFSEFILCREINDCNCTKYHNLWHGFAKNTPYYDEILHFINQN